MSALQTSFFFSRSETIWGGTAQIQRNIVAERVLGLPKEPKSGPEDAGGKLKRPPGRLHAEPGMRPGISMTSWHSQQPVSRSTAAVSSSNGEPSGPDQPSVVNDFIWFDERGLVGFLGIYGFRPDQVEMCGMVHPDARRQGVFSTLFDAAMSELRSRGAQQVLLVVHRGYEAGAAFARSVGGAIEHSEHRMALRREPAPVIFDPLVSSREARPEDASFVMACVGEAFGLSVTTGRREELRTLYLRKAVRGPGQYAGHRIRAQSRSERFVSIATTTLPASTGSRCCRSSRAAGSDARCCPIWPGTCLRTAHGTSRSRCRRSNDAALRLYLSCGFDVMGTEDYFAVPVRAWSGS